MGRNTVRARLAALLLACMLLAPVCAFAQEAADVSEEVKNECLAAGGQLLSAPLAVQVVSPYGTQSVVLRDAPSNSYDAVAMLMVGQEITAVGTAGEFYFVMLGDGSTGWLAANEVGNVR